MYFSAILMFLYLHSLHFLLCVYVYVCVCVRARVCLHVHVHICTGGKFKLAYGGLCLQNDSFIMV
jgi:hypothetical protein